jgi:hypothetical protein
MGKWLAAFGAILLVVLVLLWRELDSSSAATAVPAAAPAAVARGAEPAAAVKPVAAAVESAAQSEPSAEKMDPQSDEFFHHHDEVVIPKMMRQAVTCWENLPKAKRAEFHRNQSMTAKFKQRIRNGVVTIYDLEVERSSISDPALEACFLQQLRSTSWSNSRLPDWDQEDQIKLGPRTLKKYTKENIEYVGSEDGEYQPYEQPSPSPSP